MDKICDAKECTMCMACFNACPKKAIYVSKDEFGFKKISINNDLCINCGLCTKICESRKQIMLNYPLQGYAAQIKDKKKSKMSASGGVFQMIAEMVLDQGGVCYGASSKHTDSGFINRHIRIDKKESLVDILNSKYFLSDIGDSLSLAKKDLENGLLVLFSGTPCQILGLKAFLRKEYNNLITTDIICHGVASAKLFNDYINTLEKNKGINIIDYSFRDKDISWGTNYSYTYNKKGRIKKVHHPRELSSFMINYLKGNLFRENCYACKLSQSSRISDLTLGDFWEIELTHPELITAKDDRLEIKKGINCILVNTLKGKTVIECIKDAAILKETDLDSIILHNDCLRNPSKKGINRDEFLNDYIKYGYDKVENKHSNLIRKRRALLLLKNKLKLILPDKTRIYLYKKIFGK